jgi:hypothetical protein
MGNIAKTIDQLKSDIKK